MRTLTLFALLSLSGCMTIPPANLGGAGMAAEPEDDLRDSQIVYALHTIHEAEIELARLALEKDAHPESNAFARRMIEDHGALLAQTRSVAEANKLPHPEESVFSQELALEAQEIHARLEPLEGDAFAHAYLDSQVQLHARAVELTGGLFEDRATRGGVEDLIDDSLPVLQQHHQLAAESLLRARPVLGS